jgi:hypothetical protein
VKSVITLLVAVALSSCANNTTGPSTGAITVSGKVFDFTTRAPLAAAVVDFRTDIQTPYLSVITDNSGQYVVELPHRGAYNVSVNNGPFGQMYAEGRDYRGDLLADTGTCVARFGTISDAVTGRPLGGAKVSLGSVAISASDGWYTLDLGCPEPVVGGGTTLVTVELSGYEPRQQVVGRGIQRVSRLDIPLKKAN